jgi:hypothetical protein
MTNPPPAGGGGIPDDEYRQSPEAALGGADAVEKTTYVTGSGTEPERTKADAARVAKAAGTGPNATWAILIFLAVGAVLVYLMGWGR